VRIAIGDWITALLALISLVLLLRTRVSDVVLVSAAAVAGLVAFPLLQPTWVFLK
jgi:chromate transporter